MTRKLEAGRFPLVSQQSSAVSLYKQNSFETISYSSYSQHLVDMNVNIWIELHLRGSICLNTCTVNNNLRSICKILICTLKIRIFCLYFKWLNSLSYKPYKKYHQWNVSWNLHTLGDKSLELKALRRITLTHSNITRISSLISWKLARIIVKGIFSRLNLQPSVSFRIRRFCYSALRNHLLEHGLSGHR